VRAVDLFRFSATSLRGHSLRTLFSLLGVTIGVCSVIILTSLGEGARRYITGEFASLGTNLLIVIPGKTETYGAAPLVNTAPNDLTVADAEALGRRIPSIERVAPVAMGTAPAACGERSRDIIVLGSTHETYLIRHLKMSIGRFLPPDVRDAPVCVLGSKVQTELFGNRNPLGEMVRIGEVRFRVIGVLAPRGMSIGWDMDEIAYVPVENGLRLFNRTSLFRVLAQVRSAGEMKAAEEAARALLKQRHSGIEDVTLVTQDAVMATFNHILHALTLALAGIAAISLTVAGIGIMNVMLVSVSERTGEVGLLKAVGVTGGQVLAVFLLEASLISTAGGLLGLAAGFGASRILRLVLPDFPAAAPHWAVAAALIISISVGVLFGSLPARRAAALDPVAALMRRR
jgi:putative ABC transport system permease protein